MTVARVPHIGLAAGLIVFAEYGLASVAGAFFMGPKELRNLALSTLPLGLLGQAFLLRV